MKAADVVTAVRRHYGCERDNQGPEWAALTEFTLAPGFYARERIDLFLVRAWGGRPKGHERHAVEVKVTTADLRAELSSPDKRAPFVAVSHRFYLVEAFRRAARAEARIRGAGSDDLAAHAVRLEQAAQSELRRRYTAEERVRRVEARYREVAEVLGRVAAIPCRCGAPLAPRNIRSKDRWRHIDPDVAECSWPSPDFDAIELVS